MYIRAYNDTHALGFMISDGQETADGKVPIVLTNALSDHANKDKDAKLIPNADEPGTYTIVKPTQKQEENSDESSEQDDSIKKRNVRNR